MAMTNLYGRPGSIFGTLGQMARGRQYTDALGQAGLPSAYQKLYGSMSPQQGAPEVMKYIAGQQAIKGQQDFGKSFADIFGGGAQPPQAGGAPPMEATGPPIQLGGSPVRDGIQDAAQALGIDPTDLATVMSYETGGTFNPKQTGPKTKWGTHRGLIQFGEPQAKKYGVDWNKPVASQLGADGAVVRYLRDAGVKPGASMEDIYSAINAGRVGRPGASDEAAGGMPGTVRDKVAGMGDHRAKAQKMMNTTPPQGGGSGMSTTPPQGGGSGMTREIAKLLSSPFANPQQRAVLLKMIGGQSGGNPTTQMQNYEHGIEDPGFRKYQEWKAGLGRAPSTNVTVEGAQPPLPEYNKLPPGMVYRRDPKGNIILNDEGVPSAAPVIGGEIEADRAATETALKNRARGQAQKMQFGVGEINRALKVLDDSPSWSAGVGNVLAYLPDTVARSLSGMLKTVKAGVGFEALQNMRAENKTGGGLGNVSDKEVTFLQATLGSLDQWQDPKVLKSNLRRVKHVLRKLAAYPEAEKYGFNMDFDPDWIPEYDASGNPIKGGGGWQDMGGGVKMRRKN